MNVADSSAWLEFVNGGENGIHFRPIIEDTDNLIVPAIVVYEVFKLTLRDKGEPGRVGRRLYRLPTRDETPTPGKWWATKNRCPPKATRLSGCQSP